MAHHEHEHERGHIGPATYYKVFAALMVLMFLTVGAWWVEGMLNIPRALGVFIAVAIASTKTVLIVLFFMHIKVSSRVTQLYAVAALVALLFMFVITMGDYFARGWPPELGPLP
ncbi:cytochrome C oxidase subunit IV family protein [Candidatus Viridilinea mediisalina]|uniref:Oxidase n=1 Tax=Candidatus Viridilinea mediisalina TaxID=2024553 RepID=A0A2A6RK15_9CHLR|nr:cytochrome C oxidase subunit IV family protein [Candidatus Viridilinea mediisalina]PDW03219.1 oxidase [Candidatus Viridilinea mediisalina]